MTLIEFINEFPDELSCKSKFKKYREHIGVICFRCGCKEHYWKQDKYLDEFCYKFNRRYAGEALFNRLLVACVSYKNEFRYIYG